MKKRRFLYTQQEKICQEKKRQSGKTEEGTLTVSESWCRNHHETIIAQFSIKYIKK